jgi:hypothetical protein
MLLVMRFYLVDLGEQGYPLGTGILELRYSDAVFWSISVKILPKCSMNKDMVSRSRSLLLSLSAHSQTNLLVGMRAWSQSAGGVRDKRCSKSTWTNKSLSVASATLYRIGFTSSRDLVLSEANSDFKEH